MERNGRYLLNKLLMYSLILLFKGVFVDEVHKDGNAYQKLYPGDKIVVIEDIDLSKMEPEIAAKIVLMRGSEAENITISRIN